MLDVIVSGSSSSIQLNDGNGGFSPSTGTLPGALSHLVDGDVDVDGDGDLDALVTLETCVVSGSGDDPTRVSRVFLIDGAGSFTERVGALPSEVRLDRPYDLGDANGDGFPDLWIGEPTHEVVTFGYGTFTVFGGQNRLLVGDGTGDFAETAGVLPVVEDGARAGAFADVDGDGDDDIWASGDRDTTMLLSDGTGNLASAGENYAGDYRRSAARAQRPQRRVR